MADKKEAFKELCSFFKERGFKEMGEIWYIQNGNIYLLCEYQEGYALHGFYLNLGYFFSDYSEKESSLEIPPKDSDWTVSFRLHEVLYDELHFDEAFDFDLPEEEYRKVMERFRSCFDNRILPYLLSKMNYESFLDFPCGFEGCLPPCYKFSKDDFDHYVKKTIAEQSGKKYFFDGFCKPSHKKTTKATKENKKIDNDARRKIGKHYGFKQASYCNWIIKENYFFYVQYNQYPYFDNVEYYVKPCYFDDILLDEINIWEQKSTLSDRAIVVSAPSFMLSRTDLPSHKDEEFSAETRERVWLGIFMKAQQLIDVFLSQNHDVDAFEFESLGLNSDDNDLASMLQMLHHQQYEKVIALATSLIEKGKKGYLSWLRTDENGDVKSKSLYDYVIEYSRRKNSISFQSAAESQKIK